MQAIRQIYESLPDVINVPAELRRRKVEVIILPLDENDIDAAETDETAAQELRPFGLAAQEFVVPADFDEPLPEEVLAAFENE